MDKNIPIYFVTNWDMVGYTATTMASVLCNSKHNFDFYVMDCGLSEFDRKQLSTLKERFNNLKSLSFATVDMTRFNGLNVWYYGTLDAWAMLLFPESFPDVHGKVIHIESDTLVVDDIAKLYNENLDGFTMGAAPEIAFGKTNELFPLKEHIYFNLGMALIDCDKWRAEQTTQKCLELGAQYGTKFNCLHQDALNMLYYNNNYKCLSNRYNLGERENLVQNLHKELSNEYFAEEWKHPVIIHFSPNKPWRTQHSFYNGQRVVKYFNEWWYYASLTPYFNGLQNAFLAKKIEDEIKGLKNGVDNYGSSLIDTLPEGHPFKGLLKNNNIGKTHIYSLLGLPLMKVKTNAKGNTLYKLFAILPFLKVQLSEKKEKMYKLFSLITIFKIKSK